MFRGDMFTKILWTCVALFTGLLVISCGGDVGNNPLPSGESPEKLQPGPPVEFSDHEGYRFRLEGLRAAPIIEVPEVTEDGFSMSEAKSAPPGTTFVYVDLLVTNMQADRIAHLTDLTTNWYIQVPKQLDVNQSMIFCDNVQSNFCGNHVSCLHMDQEGANVITRLGGIDDKVRVMPAGAKWRLRCFLGTDNFGDIEGAKKISNSVKPSDIRFVRIVGVGLLNDIVKERQEVKIPNV